ncbi:hypothetical protein ASPWEDRAFT_174893 [Aspergillus wentii DTO 134E9]|uniref:Anaphase-promoting complex subunit 4 WD40 domain-containing protein n=1 Tax=Aspergillus wentii DTO 134E9 TaxID=1073089 RepID=A0A1L9REY3_ASPWE|nr:uncharacterized protein ASPWEDRAFT_174893 [Aspergillus wentii DTO 134E9]OJJ33489.1 hypothetical protein ASPWEDRAFT_174893 [Aspergillus wentii DTO 134E9]
MASSAQEAYPPDYDKPAEQIVVQTTQYLIENGGLVFLSRFPTLAVHEDPIKTISFSEDGGLLATASGGTARLAFLRMEKH